MNPTLRLHGLVAATHTPFNTDGSLHLAAVEHQAAHLLKHGVQAAFVAGSTGESSGLTVDERRQLLERWVAVTQGTSLRVVAHVGASGIAEAKELAAHAAAQGVSAIAALAPYYYKPRTLDLLIAGCAEIAQVAPETPFYFYDIPVLTGVNFPMPDFLAAARERVPTLCGIKFTNTDLMAYQQCLRADGGRWDLPFGIDETMLAALALGARGAVGSGFNFAAPVYTRMIAAFERGDLEAAREEQFRGVQIIQCLASYGYMAAAKAVMGMLGVPVGPARLPHANLSAEQTASLRAQLEGMGFFEWITPAR